MAPLVVTDQLFSAWILFTGMTLALVAVAIEFFVAVEIPSTDDEAAAQYNFWSSGNFTFSISLLG